MKFTHEKNIVSGGFTLVEVMIATLVFSVGMMAVITMEFSTLRAYTASKDLSVATDVANRTVAMMKLEGANWSQQNLGALANANPPSLYDASGNAPIDINMLGSVVTTPWTWTRATSVPVTERLVRDAQLGRYCVYVRGGTSELALGGQDVDPSMSGMDTRITPLVQAQIAVLYPTKSTRFTSANCLEVQCDTGPRLIVDLLLNNRWIDGAAAGDAAIPELERCGFRAVYASTLVSR